MDRSLAPYLRSPCCGAALALRELESQADDVREGTLECRCGSLFRIDDGIADLLPTALADRSRRQAFAERHGLPPAAFAPPGPPPVEADQDKRRQIGFYASNASRYDRDIAESPFWQALDDHTFFTWLHRQAPGCLILEIGAGTSRMSLPMATTGRRVLCLDISEEMLREGRRKTLEQGLHARIGHVVADAEAPPVAPEAFDACTCYGMLHHTPDPARIIRAASRALGQGGSLYTVEPHKSPVRFLYDIMMRLWPLYEEEARDEPCFTEAQLAQWTGDASLALRAATTVFLPPHLLALTNRGLCRALMAGSDRLFHALGLGKLGGLLIVEATKGSGT